MYFYKFSSVNVKCRLNGLTTNVTNSKVVPMDSQWDITRIVFYDILEHSLAQNRFFNWPAIYSLFRNLTGRVFSMPRLHK